MTCDKLDEPWSRTLDAQHPVRWSPADGDTPAYLTVKGAAERLARWFDSDSPDPFTYGLLAGERYRTAFAFYVIDDPQEVHP